jgi:hypothetical protein
LSAERGYRALDMLRGASGIVEAEPHLPGGGVKTERFERVAEVVQLLLVGTVVTERELQERLRLLPRLRGTVRCVVGRVIVHRVFLLFSYASDWDGLYDRIVLYGWGNVNRGGGRSVRSRKNISVKRF